MARKHPNLNVVLNPTGGVGSGRAAPSADLAPHVEWIWEAWWDRRGILPHVVEMVTDTALHLVFETGGANVVGVVTRKFTRRLEGLGRVVGIKFKPAAFRPFSRLRAAALTDRRLPLEQVMDATGAGEVIDGADEAERRARAERFLRARLPPTDPSVALVQSMVRRIEDDRDLVSVAALGRAFDLHTRRLQRLFDDYLGVAPKWVIRRHRLLEAAERISDGDDVSLAQLAASLGYFDQSHLVRDFKYVIGRSPAAYRRERQTAR